MAKIDWQIVKNEYEVMHTSIEGLAQRHDVSTSVIAHAVKAGDWKLVNTDTTEIEDDSERLAIMQSRNDVALVPKFIALQTKMLDKCDVLLDSVVTITDANNLKIVSEVIEKHRPAILGIKKDGPSDNQFSIKILNQFGDKEQPSLSAVEITSSAGQSNGVGAVLIQ